MNIDDILRGLFGFGSRHNHPFNERGPPGNVGDFFSNFPEEMQRQMDELNQQMESMFNIGPTNTDDADPPGVFVFQYPHYGGDPQTKVSPRDQMLKQPDEVIPPVSAPQQPERLDVSDRPDEQVQPYHRRTVTPFMKIFDGPFFDIKTFGPKGPIETENPTSSTPPNLEKVDPRVFTQQSSFSTRTIRGEGGRVEHRKVIRRPDGKVEETVTRSLGDKSHTCTTITDGNGENHKTDSFINIQHGDLSNFNNMWDNKTQGRQLTPTVQPKEPFFSQQSLPGQEDGILKKIFNVFKPKS